MYGEDSPEDHNAIKVAAHELKSAISLLSVRPSNLCLPLMTLASKQPTSFHGDKHETDDVHYY